MWAYSYGGWPLRSAFPLRGLPELDASPTGSGDLHVQIDNTRIGDRQPLFQWPGRYGLTLHDLARGDWLFSSRGGTRIRVDGCGTTANVSTLNAAHTTPDQASEDANDVLVRRVLPRMAILRGRLAVHAAALITPRHDGALLLTGATHAGKSTWTAAATQAGWPLLSDDITVLDAHQDGSAWLAPSSSGVCLWADSQRALQLPPEACQPMLHYDGKVHFSTPAVPQLPSQPLKAIVALSRGPADGRVHVEKLRPTEAMALLGQQLIRFNPAHGAPQEMARQLPRLARLAAQVPAWRLHYPARYDALPAGLAALTDLT